MGYIINVHKETVSNERDCFFIEEIPEGMTPDSIELYEYAESEGIPLRPVLRQDWREIANDLISKFDLEKVQRVMLHLGWKWGSPPIDKTPSIEEMKEVILHLIYNAVLFQKDYSSGGFEVFWHGRGLGLRFCLEEYPA